MAVSNVDSYLRDILNREQVDSSIEYKISSHFNPIIDQWASGNLIIMQTSGSFAKGTANKSGTDIDLFISLVNNPSYTTKGFYTSLFTRMEELGYRPKMQNVSINVSVGDMSVDLVPGQLQGLWTYDHSLYCRKKDSWIKTNIQEHIDLVRRSGCIDEIRLLKLWRNQKELDFPSFYLELTVIEALKYCPLYTLSERIEYVLRYLKTDFCKARVVDPANTNNIISDSLNIAEHENIRRAASSVTQWGQFVR